VDWTAEQSQGVRAYQQTADAEQGHEEGLLMAQTSGIFPALSDNVRRKPKKGKKR
jgi:hypothetical protein